MSATYKTEGYVKELTVKGASDSMVSFEPAKEWLVDRENMKCVLLEEYPGPEKKYEDGLGAKVISTLKVKIESPCELCLIKNLVAIKINKSRIRIIVEEIVDNEKETKNSRDTSPNNRKSIFVLKSITLV